MKISTIESLHCNAGWCDFSFLKITTDDGLVGYSEYNQSYGSRAYPPSSINCRPSLLVPTPSTTM